MKRILLSLILSQAIGLSLPVKGYCTHYKIHWEADNLHTDRDTIPPSDFPKDTINWENWIYGREPDYLSVVDSFMTGLEGLPFDSVIRYLFSLKNQPIEEYYNGTLTDKGLARYAMHLYIKYYPRETGEYIIRAAEHGDTIEARGDSSLMSHLLTAIGTGRSYGYPKCTEEDQIRDSIFSAILDSMIFDDLLKREPFRSPNSRFRARLLLKLWYRLGSEKAMDTMMAEFPYVTDSTIRDEYLYQICRMRFSDWREEGERFQKADSFFLANHYSKEDIKNMDFYVRCPECFMDDVKDQEEEREDTTQIEHRLTSDIPKDTITWPDWIYKREKNYQPLVDSFMMGLAGLPFDSTVNYMLDLMMQPIDYKENGELTDKGLAHYAMFLYIKNHPRETGEYIIRAAEQGDTIEARTAPSKMYYLLNTMGTGVWFGYGKEYTEEEHVRDSILSTTLDSIFFNDLLKREPFRSPNSRFRARLLLKLWYRLGSEKAMDTMMAEFPYVTDSTTREEYLYQICRMRFSDWREEGERFQKADSFFLANHYSKEEIKNMDFYVRHPDFFNDDEKDQEEEREDTTQIEHRPTLDQLVPEIRKFFMDTTLGHLGKLDQGDDLRMFSDLSNAQLFAVLDSIDLIAAYQHAVAQYLPDQGLNADHTVIWLRKIIQIIGDRHLNNQLSGYDSQIRSIIDQYAQLLDQMYGRDSIYYEEFEEWAIIDSFSNRYLEDEIREQLARLWDLPEETYFKWVESGKSPYANLGAYGLKIIVTEPIVLEIMRRIPIAYKEHRYVTYSRYVSVLEHVRFYSRPNATGYILPPRRKSHHMTKEQAMDWRMRLVEPFFKQQNISFRKY